MMKWIKSDSLSLRLVAGAAIWSIFALAAGGVVLSGVFRASVERAFDDRLETVLNSLIATADVEEDGSLTLIRPMADARFDRVYSGWYWQIVPRGSDPLASDALRSRSLWDTGLPIESDVAERDARPILIHGPDGQSLRAVKRVVTLPGADEPHTVTVAGDLDELMQEIAAFDTTLTWAFIGLVLGLLIAQVISVQIALQPLRRLQAALANIRSGRAARLDGRFPTEISPLAEELNKLVAHNANVVERARTQVGNLAHALKTPLSVLKGEEPDDVESYARLVRKQTEVMEQQIEHYLARARTAAMAEVLGARTPVAPVIEDLARTLGKLHRNRDLSTETEAVHVFRGERQDFEEIVGNLMENACKWADSEVLVRTAVEGGRLIVTVEDDGPGLRPEVREAVLRRGARLDESQPGSGLGLAIVKDIAAAYGGALQLSESPLGGLAARVSLPAAPPD
jgi:signal transduction histidine kinase